MKTVGSMLLALACTLVALAAAPAASAHGRLLPPRGTCGGESNLHAPAAVQRRAMRCLHNHARRRAGARPLRSNRRLRDAATTKARRIVSCRHFSHTPCGTSFGGAYRRTGYGKGSWSIGENIAWGAGKRGKPRPIFHSWLHSASHRANLLRSEWRNVGIARRHAKRFYGRRNVSIWVVSFGRP